MSPSTTVQSTAVHAQQETPAAERWDFPCPVPAQRQIKTLTVYGEIHDEPTFVARKEQLKNSASEGKTLLGLEGMMEDTFWSTAGLQGIEGYQSLFISYVLTRVLIYWNEMAGEYRVERVRTFANLVELAGESASLREPLQRLQRSDGSSTSLDIIENLIRLDSTGRSIWFQDQRNLESLNAVLHTAEMGAALRTWGLALIENAEAQALAPDLEWDLARRALQTPDAWRLPLYDEVVSKFVISWRNANWVKSIGLLYCRAIERGIPAAVVVGSRHVEDLLARLKTASFGIVPIERGTNP